MIYSETGTCCLCGGKYHNYGYSPAPVLNDNDARCCFRCNVKTVYPARGYFLTRKQMIKLWWRIHCAALKTKVKGLKDRFDLYCKGVKLKIEQIKIIIKN